MNYIHVIASMDPRSGGPCQGVRNLIPRVGEQGHAAEVVCLDDPNSDYLHRDKLPIHALGKGRGAWHYHPALRPWLEANLPAFEAVVLNGLWLYPTFLMSRLPGTRDEVADTLAWAATARIHAGDDMDVIHLVGASARK